MADKDAVASEIVARCSALPFPLLNCENISHTHHGHAGAHEHSHFHLSFQTSFSGSKERLKAHQQVMQALSPMIGPLIHSVVLSFEKINQ